MKILVLAYALSPFRGSEFSVSWNYVEKMGRRHQLDVLIGLTDKQMGILNSLDLIKEEIRLKGLNVNLIPVYPTFTARLLNKLNTSGFLPYAFYWAYTYWHKEAYRTAQDLMNGSKYDLVHYLNPIGYREPGFLWRLEAPYIWGPIGGLRSYDRRLFRALRWSGRIDYYIRKISNSLNLRFSRRLKSAVSRADLMLVNNSSDLKAFSNHFSKEASRFSESWSNERFRQRSGVSDRVKLLWVGTLNQRKGLVIFLRALMQTENEFEVTVIGEGSERQYLERFVESNCISGVKFFGHVSREEVQDQFYQSDYSVYTSLMDANPAVIWESLSNGTPVIGLKLDGFGDLNDPRFTIQVDVEDLDRTITNFGKKLDYVFENRLELSRWFNENIQKAHDDYKWDNKIGDWEGFYNRAIEKYNER